MSGSSATGGLFLILDGDIQSFKASLVGFGEYNIAVNCLKPRGAVNTEGMMVKATVFLTAHDGSGVAGLIATNEQICAWHGL